MASVTRPGPRLSTVSGKRADEELVTAALKDDTATMKRLIDAGANVNCSWGEKRSSPLLPVHTTKSVTMHLRLTLASPSPTKPLHETILVGDYTPLAAAAWGGNQRAVALLLSTSECDVDALNRERKTAFWVAFPERSCLPVLELIRDRELASRTQSIPVCESSHIPRNHCHR